MVDAYDIVRPGEHFVLLIRIGLSVDGVLRPIRDAHCEYLHTFALVGPDMLSSEARIALQTQGFYFQENQAPAPQPA